MICVIVLFHDEWRSVHGARNGNTVLGHLDMRVLAKLYPKGDSADRATAMIADIVFLTVLLAGGLYWWHSAQPEHGQDALPQAVASPRDRGEGPQPARPIPVHRHFEPGALHRGVEGP